VSTTISLALPCSLSGLDSLESRYAVFFASYEFLKRSFAALPFLRAAPGGSEGEDDPHGAGGLSPVAVIMAGTDRKLSCRGIASHISVIDDGWTALR
jgi:hypothetical protein